MKQALTYDDIQLIPRYSSVKSRKDISLKTLVSRRYGLLNPFVAAPMDTVCEEEMAYKMFLYGGVGCIHRFMSIEEQSRQIKSLKERIYDEKNEINFESWGIMYDDWHAEIKSVPIMAAIGVQEEDKERATSLVASGANILVIDVAHGHHINVGDMLQWCKHNLPEYVDIIAGNIATSDGAEYLIRNGADGLRVGIGGGCFTPHMKVKTNKGLIDISEINSGDMVYSHTGKENLITEKFEFNIDEEIIIVNDIECTKNHEFYVINKIFIDKINNDNDIHHYAEWLPSEKLTSEYFLIEL